MRVSEKTGDEWWKDKAATNKMYLRLWNPRLDVVVPYLWTCVYRTEYVQFVRYGRYWRWMKAIILLRFRTFFYDYASICCCCCCDRTFFTFYCPMCAHSLLHWRFFVHCCCVDVFMSIPNSNASFFSLSLKCQQVNVHTKVLSDGKKMKKTGMFIFLWKECRWEETYSQQCELLLMVVRNFN